jgi:hypothetical protein
MSKMEATIENIASLAIVGNLAINQLMEREAGTNVTTKVAFTEEPKWTIVITKNVHRWSARLWRPLPMCLNKRSASSTYDL